MPRTGCANGGQLKRGCFILNIWIAYGTEMHTHVYSSRADAVEVVPLRSECKKRNLTDVSPWASCEQFKRKENANSKNPFNYKLHTLTFTRSVVRFMWPISMRWSQKCSHSNERIMQTGAGSWLDTAGTLHHVDCSSFCVAFSSSPTISVIKSRDSCIGTKWINKINLTHWEIQ